MQRPCGSIRCDIVSVMELFNGSKYWVIPEYQRPYVWKAAQVNRLLDDVWKKFEQREGSDASSFHFIGVLVSANDPSLGELRHEVVDGQQRIITLILVLRALAYFVEQEKRTRPGIIIDGEAEPPADAPESVHAFQEACKDICAWTDSLHLKIGGTRDGEPIMGLGDVVLKEWFQSTFLQDGFTQLIDEAFNQPKNAFVEDTCRKGFYLDACRAAHVFLKRKFRSCGQRMRVLADFIDYFMRYILMTHTVTKDIRPAFDIFDSLNGTGLQLTEIQKIKALMFPAEQREHGSSVNSARWAHAEERLGRISFGGRGQWNAPDLLVTEPLRPYLVALAELAEAECRHNFDETKDQSRKTAMWTVDLQRHFLENFEVMVDGSPKKLFDVARKPVSAIVQAFFNRHFDEFAVQKFASFFYLEDKSWLSFLPYGEKVQTSVALLRYLGHLDLDMKWVVPANAFTVKYLRRECEHSATSEQVLAFFRKLEHLAAYILFAVPRVVRVRARAREAASIDYDPASDEHEQLQYIHRVQVHYYRSLTSKITSKNVEDVLSWMTLSDDEISLFGKRFPSVFPETQWQKRVVYLLLRADVEAHVGSRDRRKMLVELLPKGLFEQPSRETKSAPLVYRQPFLEHIVPRTSNVIMRSCSKSTWVSRHGWTFFDPVDVNGLAATTEKAERMQLESLGNYAALVMDSSDTARGRDRLGWEDKMADYKAQSLSLTRAIADYGKFGPEACRKRTKSILELLSKAWSVDLKSCWSHVSIPVAPRQQQHEESTSIDSAERDRAQEINDYLCEYGSQYCHTIGGKFHAKQALLRKYFRFDEYDFVMPNDPPSIHSSGRQTNASRGQVGTKGPGKRLVSCTGLEGLAHIYGIDSAEMQAKKRAREARFGT